MKLIFLDTETTGLEKDPGAEVISYAFAEWEDGKIIRGIDSQLVLPRHGCPESAAKINGYSEEKWLAAGAKPWSTEDTQNVCSYLTKGCIVAGSNPKFDVSFLRREFSRAEHMTYWNEPSHRYLNTASLGFPLWAEGLIDGVGLDYLAAHFGIEYDAHTAEGDVGASIQVWEKFHDEYIYWPRTMRSALAAIADNYPESPELVKFCTDTLEECK